MTAIALAIVWYSIVNSEELKDAPEKIKNIGYGIGTFALVMLFMLSIKDVFR